MLSKQFGPFFVILSIVSVAFTAPVIAQTMTASDSGIVIDDGAGGKLTLNYPTPCGADKKPEAVTEKNVAAAKATLKFAGGSSAEIDLVGGDIRTTLSNVSADNKLLYITFVAPVTYLDGGKFNTGNEDALFPKEKGDNPNLYLGASRTLALHTAAGGSLRLEIPEFSYQQLMDERQFNSQQVQWQAWIPIYPENPVCVIHLGDVVPKPKDQAPASPTAKSADNDKEMLRIAEEKPAPPRSADGTDVMKWKDGKRAVFLLAFDDSCMTDLTNVIPELNKRKIPGTFYVIAGSGMFKDHPAEWTAAAQSPYVILGNHTFTHKAFPTLEMFEDEIAKSNDAINADVPQLKKNRLISYGKPGGTTWGPDVTDDAVKPILARYNLVDRPPFWGSCMQVKNSAQMEALVDTAIKNGEMGHLDHHGVGGDWLVTPIDFFHATLDKLEKNRDQLWLTDHVSYAKYLAERKTARVKVLQNQARQIRLTLNTEADPALYDAPLTLATKVPADWKTVQVAQDQAKTTVTATDGFVRYDAMPGAAEIVLTAGQ